MSDSNDFNPLSTDAVLSRILASQEGMSKDMKEHIGATQLFRKDLDGRLSAVGERIAKVEADVATNTKEIAKLDGNQKKVVAAAGLLATAGGTAGGGWLARLFGGH